MTLRLWPSATFLGYLSRAVGLTLAPRVSTSFCHWAASSTSPPVVQAAVSGLVRLFGGGAAVSSMSSVEGGSSRPHRAPRAPPVALQA
jgi:hypothetical protein